MAIMKKLIVLTLLLFSVLQFAQDIKHRLPIFFDYIVIPQETTNECIISYKIPFNQLLFVKDKTLFKSGVSINFEIKNGDFIKRVYDEREIFTSKYKNTQSSILFLEGIVKTNLKEGTYKITPTIELHNTNISSELLESELRVKKEDENFIKPFVITNDEIVCEGKEVYTLNNFRGNISFSNLDSKLLIPIKKILADSIKIIINQSNNKIVDRYIKSEFKGEVDLEICDNKIIIPKNGSSKFNFYILKDFADVLDEGKLELIVEINDIKKTFQLESEWINKPKSLKNILIAVKALKLIDEENNFNDNFDDESYEDLKKFWKKYDPTPDTEFNELMNEFYKRVDYSIREFSTIQSFDGAFTDRGEVYVKFGKPEKIERNYNKRNEIIETWIYSELNKVFIFKDISGTGDFKLIN